MKFYCINSNSRNKRLRSLLKSSARANGISLTVLNPEEFDYTSQVVIGKGDLLYRITTDEASRTLEKYLITHDPVSFYQSRKDCLGKLDNVVAASVVYQRAEIPIPKTVYYTSDNKSLLGKYCEYLGGFPIIIKIEGGSHGVGVMKIDSLSSLLSVVDYLFANQSSFILREFIDIGQPTYSYRAVVLSDKVEITYKNVNISSADDFRSNSNPKDRRREIVELSSADKKVIVKSVSVLGLELGAVDFVYNQDKELKIFEVNFPFDFVPIVEDLKYNINDKIVEYLLDKAEKDQ